MKINPSFLLKMLAPMQVVIPKRHILPIIECLKLDSQGFTGTNLEQTIHIPYKNLPEVCIDFREFTDTLKTLGNRIVEMNLDSETFEITFSTGEMTMKMYGQNNESYPIIKEFITGTKTTIPDLSGFVQFASKDEHKPSMNGIFVSKDICSTDAHRLKWEPNQYYKEGNPNFILPTFFISKLCNTSRTIEINENQELARIHLDFGFLQTKLIQDKYPEYANVIPALSETFVRVNRNQFISSLQASMKSCNQTTFQVRLSLTGTEMTISAEDIDYSKEFKTTIPCEWTGEPEFEIGFNAKFLIECLRDCKGETVTLNLTTPNRVGRINENMLIVPVMIEKPVYVTEEPETEETEELEEMEEMEETETDIPEIKSSKIIIASVEKF